MRKNILFLIPIFGIILFSCVQETEYPLPKQTPKVSVSCLLTNQDEQKLTLKWNDKVNGESFDEVENASVTLYKGLEKVGVFVHSGYGEWTLKYRPESGQKYKLEIYVEGQPLIDAETTMPIPTKLTPDWVIKKDCIKKFKQTSILHPVWLCCLSSSIKKLFPPLHEVKRPHVEDDERISLLKEIGTDHKNADRFNQEGLTSDFNYLSQEMPAYKYYVRIIPDKDITPQAPYFFCVQHIGTEASFLVFRTVSDEYDRFLKSVGKKMSYYETENDISSWFEEATIYSNIHNGLGIFGAYHQISYYYYNMEVL